MRSRVYETVELSHHLTAAAPPRLLRPGATARVSCATGYELDSAMQIDSIWPGESISISISPGLLLSAVRVGDIDRQRRWSGA